MIISSSSQEKRLPFHDQDGTHPRDQKQGRWWYEIRAEWTDPQTGNTYVFTSGVKKGLPGYRRGDYLAAYVSPYGNYLQLS